MPRGLRGGVADAPSPADLLAADPLDLANELSYPQILASAGAYRVPGEGMPVILRGIGLLFPVTHMIAIMRGVVLRDASIFDLWPHVAALLAMSVVLVWLGSRSVRKIAA